MDFTLKNYKSLLIVLQTNDYFFQTFEQFISNSKEKVIILRHDVDLKPQNSLRFAQIQNEMGIKGTYYFRLLPCSYDEDIIKQLVELGHEIGYHYENLSVMSNDGGMNRETGDGRQNTEYGRRKTGDGRRKTEDGRWETGTVMSEDELFDLAIKDFEQNLEKLRKLYPVKTICMHGSPLSKIDNKRLWEKINYRDYGIIAEPYYDVNFNDVLYITDTGRRWNGDKVSVRDKVKSKYNFNFQHTYQIIKALEQGILPDKIMFTFHPQRWNDKLIPWTKELIMQNVKNVVKRVLVRNE